MPSTTAPSVSFLFLSLALHLSLSLCLHLINPNPQISILQNLILHVWSFSWNRIFGCQ
jgi:hypothetical protein